MLKSRSLIVSFLVVLVTSLISFMVRYVIMIYGGIDLFYLVDNPIISFISFFGINAFRLSFRIFLKETLDCHSMNSAPNGTINSISEEDASTGGAGASTGGANLGGANSDGANP